MGDATESTRRRCAFNEGRTRELRHWKRDDGVVPVSCKEEGLRGEC